MLITPVVFVLKADLTDAGKAKTDHLDKSLLSIDSFLHILMGSETYLDDLLCEIDLVHWLFKAEVEILVAFINFFVRLDLGE